MKTKSRKTLDILFTSFLVLLFFIWVGSFLKLNSHLKDLLPRLEFNEQEAIASENDVEEAMAVVYLDDDTMYVQSDSAFPGEEVWITIGIKNTRSIAGFAGAIVYNSSILFPETTHFEWVPCPDTCPPETLWTTTMEKTARTESVFVAGPYFGYAWSSGVVNKHLDTTNFFAYVGFERPGLSPDTGAVARIKFRVKPTAPQGETIPIEWAVSVGVNTLPNNWSDYTGDTTYVPQTLAGTFKVRGGGGPGNQCPVFASMPDTQVNEGATLSFNVAATDADGDTIHLYIDPIDPDPGYNYSFPDAYGEGSASQTFSFSPTFGQGPATVFATFRADDGQCVTSTTVRIEIIETALDLLAASSEQGGVPGSYDRMVPLVITNSIPIYGFQFTLRWDYTMVDVDSFVPTDVIQGFSIRDNVGDSLGAATVLVFGLSGQTIPAGIETVLYAAFSVEEDAQPGEEVTLQLENAVEAVNPGEPSFPLGVINGKFTIDLFGDANIDRLVNIADVVSIVAYILGHLDFTSREFLAADVTENDTVDVADLVGIINIILGWWTGPSPSPYSESEPPAIVRLDYEDLQPGTAGEVRVLADLEVPVAGAQLRLRYDPEQLSFEAPRLSEWSDKFIAEYRDDKQGELTVLLYNWANDPILPGEGNMLSLPAKVSPNAMDKIKLEIDEIVLSDQNAVRIPVDDGKSVVPKMFELSQNYPNPFNPTTTIKYTLPSLGAGEESLPTNLKIYNILGEVVKTLVDEPRSPGVHHEVWDGKDDQGNQVASGVYLYRLKAGEFSETKKMVLLK